MRRRSDKAALDRREVTNDPADAVTTSITPAPADALGKVILLSHGEHQRTKPGSRSGVQTRGKPLCGCPPNDHHADIEMFINAHLNIRLVPIARRYVGFRGLPEALVQDVVFDALGRAWEVWDTKLAWTTCGRRCGFTFKTMSNVAHEMLRQQRRNGEACDPSDLPEVTAMGLELENHHLAKLALRAAIRALDALGDEDRSIIDLAIAEISHSEIASQLNLTSATNVGSRLHRIRNKLAETVGPDLLKDLGLRLRRNQSGGQA